ncbi:ATP-grasp domain-containing protein [Mycetocola lacteus]|uniref:ATP-grasp domain-containing protein n=1 Tax=Mycetocola lacteus TaxID=76637 RepID=A0A3L7ASW7_9MICO|nr:ATP-grasp domain-containing protein [Mycetocola lacteus]RLP83095.1 ATP-grasp domain-containing protein [Mycetocola lacteus]
MTPRIAIVGHVPRAFREYVLRAARSVAEIWLITDDAAAEPWHHEYCANITELPLNDAAAEGSILALIAGKVRGILTVDERYVELTARLVATLSLPGATPEAVGLLKDKASMRALTWDQDYAIRFRVAHTVAEAREAAAQIGYPVVVKPRSLGGSIGVSLVTRAEALPAAVNLASEATVGTVTSAHAGVLIEEYVEGEEISVDSSISNGLTTVHFISDKTLGLAPYFEEVEHHSPSRFTDVYPAITRIVHDIHTRSGFDQGITHIEFRLSPHGPRLIEANARLGGDLVPHIGFLAGGVNLAVIATQLALGHHLETVVPDKAGKGGAAIAFIVPQKAGFFKNIVWPAVTLPTGVHIQTEQLLTAGDFVAPPPTAFLSRVGLVIGYGPDAREAHALVHSIARDTQLVLTDG